MDYKKLYSVILVCLVFFTIVQGSCLEYGHSCWGAHGKRSGGKIYRPGTNLHDSDLNALTEDNANAARKPLFDNMEDQNTPAENGAPNNSAEDAKLDKSQGANAASAFNIGKLFRKHKSKPLSRKDFEDLPTDSMEQQRQERTERWNKLPLYNLRNFAKPQSLTAAESELLQQLERKAAHRNIDEGLLYDFA